MSALASLPLPPPTPSPTPPLAPPTPAGVADWLEAIESRHVELVDGELIDQGKDMLSLLVAANIVTVIRNYAFPRGLGLVAAEVPLACFDFISRNHGRKPDVVYYRREKLPLADQWTTPMRVMPQLVIEVLSPTNFVGDLEDKIREYFRAGAELVWVVYPPGKLVRVYQRDGTAKAYNEADTITGEQVIPGFSAVVGGFFEVQPAAATTPAT